jgi:Domain of unknown function (DUF4383)
MTAKTFGLLIGIAFAAAGVLGFVPALLFPPPPDAPSITLTQFHGYLLGLFPVNVLHNIVHLAIGLLGIAAWRGGEGIAVTYARALAVVYAVLTVMGLIPGLKTVFGLIPIHGHDVWLHAATAVLAAYFGFRTTSAGRFTAG